MSIENQIGLSVSYSPPLWSSTDNTHDTIFASGLSFTDKVGIGYDTASITLNLSLEGIEEWLQSGLGRHVEIFNESQTKVWEGFVNQIQAGVDILSITRGPLLSVVNKVIAKYDGNFTSAAEDADSQELYGILYKILSAGQTNQVTVANNIRDTFLVENKLPQTVITIGQSGQLSLTINCNGYAHLLLYPYVNTNTGAITLRNKLIDVLEADPNSLFSSDYSNIETNTLSLIEEELDYKSAAEHIKNLVSMGGDSNNNRRIFGIYEDRKAHLQEIPTEIYYTVRLSDKNNNLKDIRGNLVEPWNIKAGRWLFIEDLLTGQSMPQVPRVDPRSVFIESITYTAPYSYSITGGKTDTLPQQLAKLGLGSI